MQLRLSASALPSLVHFESLSWFLAFFREVSVATRMCWLRSAVVAATLIGMGARTVAAQAGFPGSSAPAASAAEAGSGEMISGVTPAEALTEDAPAGAESDSTLKTVAVAATASSAALPTGTEVFPDDIKFLGGVGFPDMKGRESWDNSLAVTPDSIIVEFADSAVARTAIPVTSLTQCLYGQAATRHVGAWVAAGVLIAPIALLGIFHKSRNHFVTLSWNGADGKSRGLYLQVKKNDFRRLLNTVSYRGQIPIQADTKDQKWLLTQGVVATALPSEPKETKE